MDTDQRALLNAILAKPDDDALRLIYADWLDENGQDERAEYIRSEIQKRIDEKEASEQGRVLLHAKHIIIRSEWYGVINGVIARSLVGWDRGFPCFVNCTASTWEQHGDAIIADHPVRTVKLTANPIVAVYVGENDSVIGSEANRDAANAVWASRWPNVKFEFAPESRGLLQARELIPARRIPNEWLQMRSFDVVGYMRENLASQMSRRAFDRMLQDMGVPPSAFTGTEDGATTVTPSLIRNAMGYPAPIDADVE